MAEPRIVIIGPGAMGCGMGALMARRGARVTLVDHRPERAADLAARGLQVHYQDQWLLVPVACVADPAQAPEADLILILVKAYHTASAAQVALGVPGQAPVLTLQNGLGNYQTLAAALPAERVLAGTIVMGCAAESPGRVVISGVGETVLGSPLGHEPTARQAHQTLSACWDQVALAADVDAALWRKVLANAAINPLTALTGLRNGDLLDGGELQTTLGAVAREVAAVASALGTALPLDPVAAVEGVCRLTAANRTSMLQDLDAGRPTEIRAICGEVARLGAAAAVATPLCQALTALVLGRESRR